MNGQTMTCTHDPQCQLCAEVWQCQKCSGRNYGFQANETAGQNPIFFRFPAIIGCTAPEKTEKDILFVGLNLRCSPSNIALHRWLASNFQNFTTLARNVYMDGRGYIRPQGPEPHYYAHMRIVEKVFGQGCHFEDHAAVTEVFLCASNSSEKIYGDVRNCRSQCANTFLCRVIQRLKPKVIVSVGKAVECFFSSCESQQTTDAPTLIPMPHPGDWRYKKADRERIEDGIVAAIKAVLAGQPIPPKLDFDAGGFTIESVSKMNLIDDQDFPLPEHHELVCRVPEEDSPRKPHVWCINAKRNPPDVLKRFRSKLIQHTVIFRMAGQEDLVILGSIQQMIPTRSSSAYIA